MSPAISDGEVVHLAPAIPAELRVGDIVLVKGERGFCLHRLIVADCAADKFLTRGDRGLEDDPAIAGRQIAGVATAKEVRAGKQIVLAPLKGMRGQVLCNVARAQSRFMQLLGWAKRFMRESRGLPLALALTCVLLASPLLHAQVAVDSSSSNSAVLAGTGTPTLTIAHTTAGTNRLMLVGVSINIQNVNTATVTGVTYGGTALTRVGAHNDTGNTRRVEMWSLLAPATGTANVVVSVNIPAGGNEGVVAGVTTFTGVDQTVPLGTFVSADGVNGGNSQLDVPSVVNGMILDTLAIGGNRTATVPGPQVSQWNTNTGNTTNPDIRAVGTSRTGAPSVPISETFSNTSNWSLGAISVNPTTADIAVTATAPTVLLGNNSTYTITVSNNGPSAANSVVLTDTWPTTNLTTVSVTPSSGTTCSGAPPPITCTLPTPFNSGSTATVTVVVTASASGAYANTASITDTAPPPDPNTGNNSYTAVATVQSISCATVSQAQPGAPSGVVNTYHPGTASVTAGATSIPIGAATGAGTGIATGNLLLVIQMQDASINDSDNVAYGNGSTGAGFTALNSAGNYEFVTATNSVGTGGGTLTITGAGAGGGLVFSYDSSAATATKGQSTYQVVLVPQYTTATLPATGLSAPAWNGSTGGVLALDTSSTLNLNSATVSLDGLGFRGGAGMQLVGGVGGSNTDYWQTSPAAYTGAAGGTNGVDASKGEGIAGTPLWVESGTTFLNTGTGYPSGTAGTDGSMARGAPGNAGGGGTDADPVINDQNDGGGGGGNGGAGGFGGDSWNTNLSDGGEGGAAFPATINRVAMGGGGGAGTRNNSDGDNQASSGAAGGGIIIIRAYALTGTATLTANGGAAYNATANDAGGGGGAGGSIVVLSANGGEGGLTLQANGGRGGNAWQSQAYSLANRHGPGGGGGGGVIFVSGTPASASVTGGGTGLTLNPGVPYGSTAGAAGVSVTNATISSTSGTQSGAQCTPDMTLGKSHVGNFTRGTNASYTIPVSNISPFGVTSGLVTINDTLPSGITPTTVTGAGWACAVSGQTVSCTRSDVLAAASNYPSITLNAAVSQSAPATVTNTAVVSGGSEINLSNDTATDVAQVVSSADLAVTASGTPDPVAAGGNIVYTIGVTNNGPSAADNATLVASIPANTTILSMIAPAGWNCTSGSNSEVCTNVNMAGLASASFTMTVTVKSGTANGTVITETASVSSSAPDPNPNNNTATVTTVVGSTAPDLTVTNSASPNPVLAGNNITYTQVVTNTGSSAATTATFTENTPANTTLVSITPPAGWTCTAFPPTCTDPSVAAGSSGTFIVVYKVGATTPSGTTITDTATVNAANQSFGANSATATDIVAAATQADLALSTAATPGSVIAGNNITYTQTITNNGPATASGASFTEATPTNTTFQSVSASAGWTCTGPAVGATGTITCTNSSVAASSTADIVVVVQVPSTVAAGTITASSSVTATTSDPNSANNSTTVTTGVNVVCDLAVTNNGSPSPVAANSNITYTQVITNSGPSNCSTGTLNEATPLHTTFVSVAVVNAGGGTWTCPNSAPVACTSASVPPGSTATITAVYKVPNGTASGTIITDTATVATTSKDSNTNNNTATVNIAVAANGTADLSVTNAASPNPVNAGSNVTFTQSVVNNGPSAATTISFTDPVPANTTVVSLTGPGGWTCSTATTPPSCTIASMNVNTTANFTYVLKVNAGLAAGTSIPETDSVSSTSDPNSGNNSATVNVIVAAPSADLSITNSANPVPVQAGNNIAYTQTVNNAGPVTATGVTVTETLPANTTAFSLTGPAGWTCNVGALTCTNPSLVSGTPATITFTVTVNAGTVAGTAINDTASVSSAISDPNSANNTATASDVVATATQADLVTTNSAAPTSVAAGANITYTQTVTNNGPAAATSVSFTQTTPPNTTFQSITPPAGWTCGTVPPVGGTGTITCADGSNLATGAANTATFSLMLKVNSATPSGTNITETDTATASNIVPGLTTNSATATVTVGNPNSADMAITKTGSPNPVTDGSPLTYTLVVTNNGPASATNVTVMDTLPSAVGYLSSSTTAGSCSEAGGAVTCLLGTMANAGTATITIITLANTPGVATNTATVSADQADPNQANNTATQTETITFPTKVTLQSFSAYTGTDKNGASRVLLSWKSSAESHNLGFNVYREQNGNRVRLNPGLIAGSALLMNGALPKHSGRTYAWIDRSPGVAGGTYWLEDVDVNGTSTMHGPIDAQGGALAGEIAASESRMLSQMKQAPATATGTSQSHFVEAILPVSSPTQSQLDKQFEVAAHPAVKISVTHEGWYRVTQPDLVKAGLDPNVDPALLHLYAEALEQPMQITGATSGPGGFGPQAAINFYGTAIDTVYSGTRVYWLTTCESKGARIPRLAAATGSNQPPKRYLATVELRQHIIYFSALLTTDGDNFFGEVVSGAAATDQTLFLPHLDTATTQRSKLEVVLQGVDVFPHDVQVNLNGTPVGNLTFDGQQKGHFSVVVPSSLLLQGNNTVSLTALNGSYDISLVQSIQITYPHIYSADSDQLKFTGLPGDELQVTGFSSAPVVVDITDPGRPMLLTPQVIANGTTYDIAVEVPWTTTNPSAPARHTLLAVANDSIAQVAGLQVNHPSHWHRPQPGADIVMVTDPGFAAALKPLVQAHRLEGKSSTVISVTDLYDEFNFGEHSPYAIRQFLETANQHWRTPPSYLLLNGRASFDPRDYLGVGDLDLVPTQIVAAGSLMTASDDWFSDFTDSGMPTIATGRLPVGTLDEANTAIGKIAAYESNATGGTWTSRALLVADKDDTESFTQDSTTVQKQIPASVQTSDIFVGTVGTTMARQNIIDGINSGQLLVNYLGHGSEDQWAAPYVFDGNSAASLTNGSQLPVFLIMDCLNGYFQDVSSQPLGVTLLLAPNGGGVAVFASSGLNQPAPQTKLDSFVVQNAFGSPQTTLGESILKAKSQIGDHNVRKTFILFGDPAMRIKAPTTH